MNKSYSEQLNEHIDVMKMVHELAPVVEEMGRLWVSTIERGGKLLFMGNGGSAADAQHTAAELVGRYQSERKGLPALALTTDTSVLTSIGNDYGYETIFERQIEALAKPVDTVVAFSTSGTSENIYRAMKAAKGLGCYTQALTGQCGGTLLELVDTCIRVPSSNTPRIQEVHSFISHTLCAHIDDQFCNR